MGSSRFTQAFSKAQSQFADQVRVRYFNKAYDDVYDDSMQLVQSGVDLWVSGTIQSLDTTRGSTDANLLEQGKLVNNDTKIFFHGSLVLTDTNQVFKLQIGSPIGNEYSLIPIGGIDKQVQGTKIYKMAYVRMLTNGSLIGE